MRLIIAILALASAPAAAQESAAFLKLGMGARAVGMGGAYTSLADDSDALYWNPGGLALLERTEAGMTRAQMFLGDTYDALSVAVPLGETTKLRQEDITGWRGQRTATAYYSQPVPRGVLGFGVTRLSQSTQQGRSADRRSTGGFDSSDTAFTAAYARPISKRLQAGVALKRIQSRIADSSADALALDLGAVCHLGSAGAGAGRWRLGLAARNLGQGLRYETQTTPLPTSFAFGAAMQTKIGLLFAAEVQHRPHAAKTSFSIGTEYPLLPVLSLRAGMLQRQGSAADGAVGNVGGGFGLKWGRFNIDYAMTPFGELGSVQRVSLRTRF